VSPVLTVSLAASPRSPLSQSLSSYLAIGGDVGDQAPDDEEAERVHRLGQLCLDVLRNLLLGLGETTRTRV
jgi:hypothetical protein